MALIGDDALHNSRWAIGFAWENEVLPLSHQAMTSFSPLIYRGELWGLCKTLSRETAGSTPLYVPLYYKLLQEN
jgi:hypothetical protein